MTDPFYVFISFSFSQIEAMDIKVIPIHYVNMYIYIQICTFAKNFENYNKLRNNHSPLINLKKI